MMLLLLPLAGLLLGGEALETFHNTRPSRPIYFILPTARYPGRIRIAHKVMDVAGQGIHRTYGNMRPTGFIPTRGPFTSPQSYNIDSDQSRLDQTKRTSGAGQDFVTSNYDNHQSPSAVNQGQKPSSFGQAPKTSTINHKVSSFGEVQNPSVLNQDSKPSVSHQQHRPSGFVHTSKTPSFNPTHKPSSFHEEENLSAFNEDFKPSNFEDGNKSSTSDEDRKHTGFDEDQKPFEEDRKTSLLDKHGSHPHRNPECNLRPDAGTCRAALPRYYFDPETGTCNCFLYGGCREDGEGESPGSFFTLEECHKECRPPKLEEGPVCKNIFKEDQFISYLVDPPSQNTQTDHLSPEEFLASFAK